MKTDHCLVLPDGRRLAYAEFGQPDGYPIVYFHGTPSSRLEPLIAGNELFRQSGLRVIAADRPGMGRSDFQAQRGFSDWSTDVEFLTDAVGLEKFSVLGMSGGAGYVAACAAKIPERLRSAVIVSGLPGRMDSPEARSYLQPPYSLLWKVASRAPFLLPVIAKVMHKSLTATPSNDRQREKMLARQEKSLSAPDHAVMDADRASVFAQVAAEAFAQGVKGVAWDIRMYAREWDFTLSEIRIPLKLFHGEQDMNAPVALVQKVTRDLPGAELVTYPDEAHISTFVNHFDQIATALTGD